MKSKEVAIIFTVGVLAITAIVALKGNRVSIETLFWKIKINYD